MGGSHPALPDVAWLVALATLDQMGPARLRAVTSGRSGEAAWHEIRAGGAARGPAAAALGPRAATLAGAWARAAAALDPAELWARHRAAGVGVQRCGPDEAPGSLAAVFAHDPDPPLLVLWRGAPEALAGPRVAVVGTRDCTRYGRDLAFELGRDLAGAGVRVVSGLALGIDGAAHAGVLDADTAPPIGIVGTGLDVVYPRRNGALWRQVAERGLLVSEYPLGTGPTSWRFPARNRLIAAIADVVVVVESHESGGAMHTVDEAFARGRPVMAVPGPVRSNPSKGSNRLLAEGAQVCRDALDVVTLLGLDHGALKRGPAPVAPDPTGPGATVLDAIGWQPSATEELLSRTGLPLGELARHLDELEEQGWVTRRGGWFERVARTSS